MKAGGKQGLYFFGLEDGGDIFLRNIGGGGGSSSSNSDDDSNNNNNSIKIRSYH
jgi:hypothetical protein